MVTREKSVADAIAFIKSCHYKGTAVKVELEAQLGREREDDDSYCNCCGGDGYSYCDNCDDGSIEIGDDEYDECPDCEGSGRIDCSECDGSGYCSSNGGNWSDDDCKEYLDSHVSEEARNALIYGNFYWDGSVDSEYTFTMPIDHPEYVIEYIKAFNMLADEIGGGMDTDGAGMHIAILNSPTGNYPRGNSLDDRCASNFADAMSHLLPALYFLGSATNRSRNLHYRMPQVSMSDKYSAITGHQSVFEYRFFETCYERPEAFYDFFCTIAKTLQFYAPTKAKIDWFGKIGKIGMRDGYGLDRLYFTSKHLDALSNGLKILKPDHKTIEQLKKERNFKLNKTSIASKERKAELQWRVEFNEFKERVAQGLERQEKELGEWYDREHQYYGDAGDRDSMIRNYGTREEFIASRLEEWKKENPSTIRGYIAKKRRDVMRQDVLRTIVV